MAHTRFTSARAKKGLSRAVRSAPTAARGGVPSAGVCPVSARRGVTGAARLPIRHARDADLAPVERGGPPSPEADLRPLGVVRVVVALGALELDPLQDAQRVAGQLLDLAPVAGPVGRGPGLLGGVEEAAGHLVPGRVAHHPRPGRERQGLVSRPPRSRPTRRFAKRAAKVRA